MITYFTHILRKTTARQTEDTENCAQKRQVASVISLTQFGTISPQYNYSTLKTPAANTSNMKNIR